MPETVTLGANCTSGCKTRDHRTWGECARSKGTAVFGLESTGPSWSRSDVKADEAELVAYDNATRNGIQPATTRMRDIQAAVRASEEKGVPFRADLPGGGLPTGGDE